MIINKLSIFHVYILPVTLIQGTAHIVSYLLGINAALLSNCEFMEVNRVRGDYYIPITFQGVYMLLYWTCKKNPSNLTRIAWIRVQPKNRPFLSTNLFGFQSVPRQSGRIFFLIFPLCPGGGGGYLDLSGSTTTKQNFFIVKPGQNIENFALEYLFLIKWNGYNL